MRIVVCRGPECGEKLGSASIAKAFTEACQRHGARDVQLEWQSCFGRCSQGINALVRERPEPAADAAKPRFLFATLPGRKGTQALYQRLDLQKVETIVRQHVVGGAIVRELMEAPPAVVLPPIPTFLSPDPRPVEYVTAPGQVDEGGATIEAEPTLAKRK